MSVNFRRILSADSMSFTLRTRAVPEDLRDDDADFDPMSERNLDRVREEVVGELCDLIAKSGVVANRNRLFRDLLNREKRTGTALGEGIAIPHVRTIQARSFVMAFARSDEGLPFRAPDDVPVRIFFSMVSPPYEDRIYLRVYRELARALIDEDRRQALIEAHGPNDVWRVLDAFR